MAPPREFKHLTLELHHEAFFLPLRELLDGIGRVKGGKSMFADFEQVEYFFKVISQYYGGNYKFGLIERPLNVINNLVSKSFHRNWSKFN